jgi:hypothetical protein
VPPVTVKKAGENRRRIETGKQSQSTEPARLTSAAAQQSDGRA